MSNKECLTRTDDIIIKRGTKRIPFPGEYVVKAVHKANDTFVRFSKVNEELDLFAILGMRNLSALVGEVYASCLKNVTNGLLLKNPHQDGYPDLLLMDDYGKKVYNRITFKQDKVPFSPFIGGGIEVKATCGDVPTPKECSKRNIKKPEVGDTRVELLTGYVWKAHHRKTNNLIGLLWDFKNRIPYISALFYSSNLSEKDWGKIVQPKENAGRTTSVSIMKRGGVKRMSQECLYCENNETLLAFLSRYNHLDIRSQFDVI